MARPIKEGLSYFPLDVDSDYDDKFQLIEGLHGPTGFAAIVKMYMKIYSSGYYYRWEEKEKILMAKRIGIDSNSLNNIISDCIKYELFNEKLFNDHNILTSEGIQKRFFTAVGKRKVGILFEEFLLMELEEVIELCPKMTLKKVVQGKTDVIQGETAVNQESSTQSKVNETKVNESKVTTTGSGDSPSEEFNALQDFETLWLFPNQFQLQDLNDLIDQHGKELTSAAIRLAGTKDVVKGKAINFLKAVLKEWAENHVTNTEQVAAYQAKRDQKQKKQYSKPAGRTESMPDWANEENKGEEIDEEKQKEFAERLAKIRSRKKQV